MFKRGGVWWACIRYNGKRYQKSLETNDKKLAKALEAKIKTEIIEGKYFEKFAGESKAFNDLIDKFMKEYAPKVSFGMQTSYKTSKKSLMAFFGNCKLSEITPKTISDYKVSEYAKGKKPATINRRLAMLSKAFNLAVKEWEWIKENPVSKVPKEKENNKRDRWLTLEDERRFLSNLPQWLCDIVVFALHTGLRQNELLSLEWNRVNLFNRTIIIQETKNGNPKTVPLNKTAFRILEEKSRVRNIKNDLVFASKAGTKINGPNLIRALNEALKRAEIENFHFHDLRHTFATRLAQKGIDLYKISKLLGHYDITMTQRYAHHCPESLREGVDILDSDYNLTTVEEKGNVAKVVSP
ncbi:MAG: site-specific integrase [Planctomycetes bacterium]|nr:site-specific integrase [Planctomycetota bacterium]